MNKRHAATQALADHLGGPNRSRSRETKKRTRIQAANEQKIMDAALEVFSRFGLRGGTIDQIAELAGMSKPNLLYYFRRKQDLYVAVLSRTMEMWLDPLDNLRPDGNAIEELSAYITAKLRLSYSHPHESRLFAAEILQGAPLLRPLLETRLKQQMDRTTAILQRWIDEGQIRPVDPPHLIFIIWATTQHYADFDTQVRALTDGTPQADKALGTLLSVLLDGLKVDHS